MISQIPSVSSLYVALLGLFGCFLTIRVVVLRARTDIHHGDGGNAQLAQAFRAHANFVEQVPLALMLLVLAEVMGTAHSVVAVLGAILMVARVANAWGISHSLGPSKPRHMGAGLTLLVTATGALLIVCRGLVGFS